MDETIALFVSLGLIVIFISYTVLYYLIVVKKREDIQEGSITRSAVQTLEDLFKEQEMESIRSKLANLHQIASTKGIQEAGPLSIKKDEKLLIDEGEQLWKEWNAELGEAEPISDEQRQKDIELLKTTVSALEQLDKEHYNELEKEEVDMGKGMFYDSISRKLGRILKNKNWKELPFIQAEKLENEALGTVKHLEHDDFKETLKLMKVVGIFKDIVEIDPHTTLLVFTKTPLKFSLVEKVVLSFIAHSENSSITELQKLTGWKSSYLYQVIEDLEQRKIILKQENQLQAIGFMTKEERTNRHQKLHEIQLKKEEKENKVNQLQCEQQAKMKAEQKEKELQQKLELERKQKELEDARLKAEIEAQSESMKIDVDEPVMESSTPELLEVQKREEIIQNIQQIFTNTMPLTGGIIILQALLYYINQGPYPNMQKIELLHYIDIMKERQIIYEEISYSGVDIYIFQDLMIDDEMKVALRHFVTHGEMDMEDLETATDWDTEHAKRVLKRFYDQKILQLNQRNHFYIPGLFNTN